MRLIIKTEAVFRDGIFHSGDLGSKDEKGNVILSGRKDDGTCL